MTNSKSDYSRLPRRTLLAMAAFSLAGCGGGDGDATDSINVKPSYLGRITATEYNGTGDDLLTAGLGTTGIAAATAPAVGPEPTAAELRRLAIYTNYRALVDVSGNGGYGVLYGPNVDLNGVATQGEGKIAGTEYIAYSDDGSGRQNVTLMVQVPAGFDPANPCIITGTSSGSRGVYGAIGTSGEWGLKRGCAVAYTDKGTGNGIHDLQNNTVSLRDGMRANAAAAGAESIFTASFTEPELAEFNAATPNRFAVKHAHSQQNPEKDWGKWTLQSVEFAFYVLNERYGDPVGGDARLKRLTPANTIVIASSVSNGGAAALAAAEQDTRGLIDGVAVSEPSVQLAADNRISIRRGATTVSGTGKPLYDYMSLGNLLMPCAALAVDATTAPFATIDATLAANRCSALRDNGLIAGATTADQAASAQAALAVAGFQPESALLYGSMYSFAIPAIVTTYSNAYGRFSVKDNLCGLSFAAGQTAPAAVPLSFGTGNGIPPTAGITIANNNGTGLQNDNIDSALCQRELAVGSSANAARVRQGIGEALRSGNLRGKPALIVHGRDDTLIPVNFSSRPYFGVNKLTEGSNSKLSYIEVTNAQHFESFLAFPGYSNRYVPLHVYFVRALDSMYANLKNGAVLPPSQLVRTTPRAASGGVAGPLTTANVPAFSNTPAATDRIDFTGNTVVIPD